MAKIPVTELTEAKITGVGVFDHLMKAMKSHLEEEFTKARIRGPEYSVVYLGAMQQVMNTSLQFLLQQRKIDLEAQLLEKQIMLADLQVQTAEIERQKTMKEMEMLELSKPKIAAEVNLINQQVLQSAAQVGMINQQKLNAVTENTVLIAQECKLRAEFDLTVQATHTKAQEAQLMLHKISTEKAQTMSAGVSEDSIIGRQKLLYVAQTNGFQRDAEQKMAKLMIDTWNVRRTTDEGTIADHNNMLHDQVIGRAVNKALAGVGA